MAPFKRRHISFIWVNFPQKSYQRSRKTRRDMVHYLNDTLRSDWHVYGNFIAIDESYVRCGIKQPVLLKQAFGSTLHGSEGCLQNINLINFLIRDYTCEPHNSVIRRKVFIYLFSIRFSCNFFGVYDTVNDKTIAIWNNACCGDDWTT